MEPPMEPPKDATCNLCGMPLIRSTRPVEAPKSKKWYCTELHMFRCEEAELTRLAAIAGRSWDVI